MCVQDKDAVTQKLQEFAMLGGRADMEGFFQCLTHYRTECLQFQAHKSTQLSTSSTEYPKLFASLSKCLMKLCSRFGNLSASYGPIAEVKVKEYLDAHLPIALLQTRGDAVDFVHLWRKVRQPGSGWLDLLFLLFVLLICLFFSSQLSSILL